VALLGTWCGLTLAAGLMVAPPPADAGCVSGVGTFPDSVSLDQCQATADGQLSTAVGTLANATDLRATAFGYAANANGGFSTAVGQLATALIAGTAIGQHANAGGAATAVGQRADASGTGAVAIGQNSSATGRFASAIGISASASGTNAAAFGVNAQASGVSSLAAGDAAHATADGATALGANSQATAINATAIGSTAQATYANSTAIGTGASTTRADQIALGTGTTTYTMAGLGSAASLAAQSGTTHFVTSDASGNLATSSYGPQDIAGLTSSVATLQQNVRQAFEGTAIAIALGGGALPEGKRFAVSTNWGTFRGENAGSLAAHVRVNDVLVLNGGVAAGFQQGGVGGRFGATFAW
jgi:trimeric autotransporter adhesin